MYSSQNGAYELVNADICHSCGSVASAKKEMNQNKKSGIAYVILGWMAFAISLLFIPFLFGAVALFMGVFTYFERSEVHGMVLMFFAVAGIVLGSLLSYIVAGTIFI